MPMKTDPCALWQVRIGVTSEFDAAEANEPVKKDAAKAKTVTSVELLIPNLLLRRC
jgi:hypothetical protein